MRRRPDDPGRPGNLGEAEHEDDLSEARAIFGWLLLVLALAGVAVVWVLA
jgi:hypothetical protein